MKGSCLLQFWGSSNVSFLEEKKNPPPSQPQFLLSSRVCQRRSSGIVFYISCQTVFGSWRRNTYSCQVAQTWPEFIHKSYTCSDKLKPVPKHEQTVSVIGILLSSRVTWASLPVKDCTDVAVFFAVHLVVNLWNQTSEGTYLHLRWANNPTRILLCLSIPVLSHCAWAFVTAELLTSFSAPSLSSCLENKLNDILEWAASASVAFWTNFVLGGIGVCVPVVILAQSVQQVLVCTCDQGTARWFGWC